jgi:hypothetical protein
MTDLQVLKINDDLTATILGSLPSGMSQGRRLFQYLSDHPKASSGNVSQNCSIGNLSDCAHYLNPFLRKYNLVVGCEKPVIPIINQFNEPSNNFLWSVYRVPEAANDGGPLSNDE